MRRGRGEFVSLGEEWIAFLQSCSPGKCFCKRSNIMFLRYYVTSKLNQENNHE